MTRRAARRAPEARGLLSQPARAAARAVARLRLERAVEKAAPLVLPTAGDAAATIGNEEVHDFRVALRRLRSWIRATRGILHDTIPRRDRADLRRLARCAGAARDAQVEWLWLTKPGEPFSAPAARAAAWLADHRRAIYAAERRQLQRRTAERWSDLATSVAAALADASDEGNESLGEHLAPVLLKQLGIAQAALDRFEHRTQVKLIHQARIEVKRLRYVVEAVDAGTPAGRRALKFLRLLQDSLGELHDAHVITLQLDPLLVPHRGRRRPAGRPALRDLRALRAAVRRRELAAFREAMDLMVSPMADAAWSTLARVPLALRRHRARRVAQRPTVVGVAAE
ncbi:MAG: CHAD domain-containing protein [Gemmatimonadaceae bacterium]|nr:CHAD domain-containing protein [Gemmatimonadaceae bacterium]